MLYNFFELCRDSNLRSISFGRSEGVGYGLGQSYRSLIGTKADLPRWDYGRPWDGTLTVGLIVGLEGAPRSLPLYKSVEVWSQLHRYLPTMPTQKPRAVGYPIVLERLLYRYAGGYLPYCWRYIDPRAGIQTLVHCDNLELIHGELQGLPGELSIQDPRQVYLDEVSEHRSWCPAERLDKLRAYVSGVKTYERLSRHSFSAHTIQSLLTHMERCLSFSFDPEDQRHHRDPLCVYQNLVEPIRYVGDPISRKTPIGEIPISELMKFAQPPSFDVSPPPPIPITHPTITQTSTKVCSALAQALNQVRLTDYAIHLRLVNGSPVSHRWEYAVNRYSHLLRIASAMPLDIDLPYMLNAAVIAFRCVVDMGTDLNHCALIDLLDEADVSITKSFAEEILVTLTCQKRVVCAWHIDIAAMAFCSMGLAVENPLFP